MEHIETSNNITLENKIEHKIVYYNISIIMVKLDSILKTIPWKSVLYIETEYNFNFSGENIIKLSLILGKNFSIDLIIEEDVKDEILNIYKKNNQ